jgi:hypothetical protein
LVGDGGGGLGWGVAGSSAVQGTVEGAMLMGQTRRGCCVSTFPHFRPHSPPHPHTHTTLHTRTKPTQRDCHIINPGCRIQRAAASYHGNNNSGSSLFHERMHCCIWRRLFNKSLRAQHRLCQRQRPVHLGAWDGLGATELNGGGWIT